jgi:glutathione S-transferase
VGEHVTLADISWFCSVYSVFVYLVDAEFRREIPHAVNHFQKLAALPEFKAVAGEVPKFPDVSPDLEFKATPAPRFHRLVTVYNGSQQVKFKLYAESQASDIQETIRSRFNLASTQQFVLTDEEGFDVVVDGTLETGTYKLVLPTSETKDDYVLTYFPLRGRAETFRLAFAETKTPFTEKNIAFPDWFGSQKEALTADGTVPFGQLPRLCNGGFACVQSNAISRYLARKLNLYGANVEENAQVDTWLDVAEDIRVKYYQLVFVDKAEEKAKATYLPYAEKSFGLVEKQFSRVNEGQGWLVGASFTIADLSLWELLDQHKPVFPTILSKFPLLSAWHARVAARPNIAAYINSGKRHSQ